MDNKVQDKDLAMANRQLSIEEFLQKDEQKDLLRFLTAGSVDDGKSTLIGRLLLDSKKNTNADTIGNSIIIISHGSFISGISSRFNMYSIVTT